MKNSCMEHRKHAHEHNSNCGHTAVLHENHTDYLHDGHLHHLHDGHVDEHSIPIDRINPAEGTPHHRCSSHDPEHVHGPSCGHERIPHGDHSDCLVAGHLHYEHAGH